MHLTLTSGLALASCVVFLLIVLVQMFRDSTTTMVWLLLTAALSVPPGWYLAQQNTQRKADEVAAMEAAAERQRELARQDLQHKRDEVARNRAEAVGTQQKTILLKNNKTLENVTVKAFKDDGIVFTTEGGLIHTNWADLPEDWVLKYRDTVTAEAAATKGAEEAMALAEVEKMGRDVDVSFVRESTEKEGSIPMKGSIVKVLGYKMGGSKDYAGPNIFLVGTSREAFSQTPILKVRIYPLAQKILLYTMDKGGALVPGERLHMYGGSPSQALQMARESGVKLPELSKLQFPPSVR